MDDTNTSRESDGQQTALVAQAREIARDVAASGRDIGTARDVIGAIYEEFGGAEEFGHHIAGVLKRLSAQKPLKASVANAFIAVTKLHHTTEESGHNAIDEMTTEQIEQELALSRMQVVADAAADPAQREALSMLLARHGLSLAPTTSIEQVPADGKGLLSPRILILTT